MTTRQLLTAEEYREKKVHPKWEAFLRIHFPLLLPLVKECRQYFHRLVDDNGHSAYRAMLCKLRDVCFTCSRVYSERLSEDFVDVMFSVYSKIHRRMKFLRFEFTVPKDLWGIIDDASLKGLRNDVVSVLSEILGEGGRRVLGIALSAHYWHSSNPFAGWYPHVHGVLFDLCFDKESGRFESVDLFMGAERLALFRKLWRKKLVARLGESKAKEVDVRFHYSVGYGRLRHRTAYMFRRATVDFHRYLVNAVAPEEVDASWVKRALTRPKNDKQVVYYGWLNERVRQKFVWKLHGVSVCPSGHCGHEAHDGRCRVKLSLGQCLCTGTRVLPSKAERDRERKKVFCPSCGLLMEDTNESFTFGEVQARNGCILSYVAEEWSARFGGG